MHSIEFVEGPACGQRLRVERVQREYVYKGEHLYTVDGSGGKWRAWYAGEQSVQDTPLGNWVDEEAW